MTRHESRELAFILVFEKSFQQETGIIELIENALELELFPTNAFAENLAKRVFEHIEDIDKLIDENLVGWSAKRISKVSRAVLRVAVCELLYSEKIPVGVAINEAVEITKKYGSSDDASYVNGVLGAIAKKIQ
ncbi:MAG: transcription antitermination factor NusB [Oscillospiraceae bacterium]|nr:transcription antitermination factor NusB [Oscillospiraceae bacterium]MDD6145443.1 transcription antitermination factor NusB [Oscillospiraceae bacterium]